MELGARLGDDVLALCAPSARGSRLSQVSKPRRGLFPGGGQGGDMRAAVTLRRRGGVGERA